MRNLDRSQGLRAVIFFLLVGLLWGGMGWTGMAPGEAKGEADRALQQFESQLTHSQVVWLHRLDGRNQGGVAPSQKKLYETYTRLRAEADFWDRVLGLQQALMSLPGGGGGGDEAEAGEIAETVLQALPELIQQYHLVRPPLFQNFLINVGIKQKGFCYHWTEDLLKRLRPLRLKNFQLHWGVAHQGKMTENNCVVITRGNASFEDGLALDAWRHAGKLYWTPVKKDHYPWQELSPDQLP